MWQVKKFNELSTLEFYRLIRLRVNVFVVEQDCPYEEVDETDLSALHVFTLDGDGEIRAYGRVYEKGDKSSFGRVIVAPGERGNGLGHELVEELVRVTKEAYPGREITIEAQDYVRNLYAAHGFVPVGQVFDLDGIPHIEMKISGTR